MNGILRMSELCLLSTYFDFKVLHKYAQNFFREADSIFPSYNERNPRFTEVIQNHKFDVVTDITRKCLFFSSISGYFAKVQRTYNIILVSGIHHNDLICVDRGVGKTRIIVVSMQNSEFLFIIIYKSLYYLFVLQL